MARIALQRRDDVARRRLRLVDPVDEQQRRHVRLLGHPDERRRQHRVVRVRRQADHRDVGDQQRVHRLLHELERTRAVQHRPAIAQEGELGDRDLVRLGRRHAAALEPGQAHGERRLADAVRTQDGNAFRHDLPPIRALRRRDRRTAGQPTPNRRAGKPGPRCARGAPDLRPSCMAPVGRPISRGTRRRGPQPE
jgi:hypothetical protein